jgi:CBS domain containing-hemolysin-like protein
MFLFILAVILAAITLLAVSLQKTYTRVPRPELKRRAQHGDEFAKLLYKVAGYGGSLMVLLWIIIGLSAAGFFVVISSLFPTWFALIVSLVILWLGFAWLPNTKVTGLGNTIARYLTPPIASLLNILHPLLSRLADIVGSHSKPSRHTGLYQKEDLLDLLQKQNLQPDNRISEHQLQIASNALTYGDKLVRDVMTPRGVVKTVSVADTIGPVLMSELHKNGHSRFPVYQEKPDNVVGILYLRDLVAAKEGGKVRDIMSKDVYYVQEERELDHVLQAFIKTKRQMFIVVNSFEEVVGVITVEDIVQEILGKPVMDEFDHYEDMRAVAALQAKEAQQAKHEVKDAEVTVHLNHPHTPQE